ncbi:MAG: DUF5597 domain-containing protein [Bacteroidales bacterium]|nr:DUF5597 domain-containing protein [Bacteroidales bacterium]
MKRTILFVALSFLTAYAVSAQGIPSLQQVNGKTCLVQDGKPLILLSGELHNSTASSISYMEKEKTFDNLKAIGLNSVIATASWELVEPTEGKFDFTEVDYVIKAARERDMKVMFIWFGAFKNPFMTYAPTWMKKDVKRFPRAKDENGNDLEMPCVLSENVMKADAKAYCEFLKHVKETDYDKTVVMIQIENEPGIRGSIRDFSPLAEKAWKANVPDQLISYLKANDGALKEDVQKAWDANGKKTKGNWEQVFGKSLTEDDGTNPILNQTEHFFTAYSYAKYLDYLSSEGKKVYALPTFTNASIFGIASRGRSLGNGCSIPEFFDLYAAGAPSLDILTPNSYMQQIDQICEAFVWKGNPILIPESGTSALRGLYVIGEWDAIAFSPFGIDSFAAGASSSLSATQKNFYDCYDLLAQMEPLIRENIGKDSMRAVYLYNGHASDTIEMGDYTITCTYGRRGFDIGAMMAPATGGGNAPGGRPAQQQEPRFEGAAMFIQVSPDVFYMVGDGVNASFAVKEGVKSSYCGYDKIYEGEFVDGKFVPGRLLNGDERNAFLSPGGISVLKVEMYHY